jgi:N-acetylglucosaminyl-diphospho-decaprenol L-rhamnosyltransferase
MTVQIVVVTYNSKHVVSECLTSVSGETDIVTTVVDNASKDGTADFIHAKFPSVDVVHSGDNLGFAKAVNLGATHSGDDFILLLNPDAVIDAQTVRELQVRMLGDPSIGIAAPSISQPANRLKILETGRFPTLWRVFTHYSGLSRLSARLPGFEGQFLLRSARPQTREVDWVTGAVLMVRRDLFETLNGLSERWFMYAEDIDFCLRVQRSGFKIVYFHDLHATHLMGGSDQLSAGSPNSAPFVNLFDFYQLQLARTRLSGHLWRCVVGSGLASRAGIYLLKSVVARGDESKFWRARAVTFTHYARDVYRARKI